MLWRNTLAQCNVDATCAPLLWSEKTNVPPPAQIPAWMRRSDPLNGNLVCGESRAMMLNHDHKGKNLLVNHGEATLSIF